LHEMRENACDKSRSLKSWHRRSKAIPPMPSCSRPTRLEEFLLAEVEDEAADLDLDQELKAVDLDLPVIFREWPL